MQRVRGTAGSTTWWSLVILLALALFATGCGSDDDGGGGDGDATGSAADDGGADQGDADDSADGDDGDGGDDADDGGSGLDGCELVTAEDAEAILGEPVTQGEEDPAGAAVLLASCLWEVDQPESFKLLQLHVFDGAQFFTPEAYESEESYEEVDLGDGAYFIESLGLQLTILDGERTISLDVSGFNVDDPAFTLEAARSGLLELAPQVLDRM